MQLTTVEKRRAFACALAMAAGTLGFGATALADSFTSTLQNPSSNSLNSGVLTLDGSQSSSLGGAGSYVIVDKSTWAPYVKNGQWCLDLASGSTLTLKFSSGEIDINTNGTYCGSQTGASTFAFTGPYTITGGKAPFNSVTGSGTVSGTYDLSKALLIFNNISGTATLPAGGGGGGGGGGNPLLATPELDSMTLFGGGLLGFAGYAVARLRSLRRRRSA